MDDRLETRSPQQDALTATTSVTAMEAALAAGDVPAALRAWHEAYGGTMAGRRWEGFADAGDAYLRIARASGSPAGGISRARELYLSALFEASGTGSLDGLLRLATAFAELGDDDVVAYALQLARRLADARLASGLPAPVPVLQTETAPQH